MRDRAVVRRRWTVRRLHKWAGLTAALWLGVLGGTGFLLDHREWRWMWQSTVAEALVPQRIVDKAANATARLYRIDPTDPDRQLAGGPQGLWWSADRGATWARTAFTGLTRAPQVFDIVADPVAGWRRLWLATDDGVWQVAGQARKAERLVLDSESVTALAAGATPGELVGVVDRSRVFRLTVDDRNLRWLDLGPMTPDQRPPHINLSRLVHDLHFGRGIFAGSGSLLINDGAAVAMLALPVSGWLFWWLPRRAKKHGTPQARAKRQTLRWLYRLHGPTVGVVCILPMAYLAATGILLDHGEAFRPWMKAAYIGQRWQPPVYAMRSWERHITAVAGYPGEAEKLSVGSRLGLMTSSDNGRTWVRETAGVSPGFVWTLRRYDAALLIGGMGEPNLIRDGAGPWLPVKGAGHMPTDVSPDGEGAWVWKGAKELKVGNGNRGFSPLALTLPRSPGVPLFFIFDGLHSGVLIHPQWKWVNDGVAVLAMVLIVTGFVRWWRRKWL